MRKIIFITVFLCLQLHAHAQHLEWAAQIGGTDVDRALTVLLDGGGNSYTGGRYNGRVDFDPGPDTFFREAPRGEAYILKLDASGNFVKVITFGHTSGVYNCAVSALFRDAAGNLYASGYFSGTADFDPDTSEHRIYVSGNHAFLLKLDAADKFQWVKTWRYGKDAGETREEGPAVVFDASGNMCAAGQFKGKTDFDPGAADYHLTSKSNEGYILKLDVNGDFLWAKQLLTDSAGQEVFPQSVSTDAAGNLYIAGSFKGSVDFDPDSTAISKLDAGVTQGFLLKLDMNGNFVWVKKIGEEGDPFYDHHSCQSVSTDALGNSFITGSFVNTVSLGSVSLTSVGLSDIYVAKVDAAGNFLWARQYGSLYDTEEGSRVTQDAAGNVYVTGIYRGTVNFNSGSGVANLTSNGSVDVFVLKLTASGGFVWAKGYGGTGAGERIGGIAVSGNSIYTAGKFIGNINCDPNGSYYMNSRYSGSGSDRDDGFIHKISQGATVLDEVRVVNLTVAPNPARDMVTLDMPGVNFKSGSATVFDMQGRKMLETPITSTKRTLNIAQLSQGTYVLKVQADEGSAFAKLVVE